MTVAETINVYAHPEEEPTLEDLAHDIQSWLVDHPADHLARSNLHAIEAMIDYGKASKMQHLAELFKSFGDPGNTQTRSDHGQFGPGSGSEGNLPSGRSLYGRAINGGGFSIYAQSGLEPKTGYAVGGYANPLELPDSMHARAAGDQIDTYVEQHAQSLQSSDMVLGGWHNTDAHTVVIEPSRVFSDREAAISEGQLRNQISIYDIAGDREIPTGGSGQYAAKALTKPAAISCDVDGTLNLAWVDGTPRTHTLAQAQDTAPDYAAIAAINAIYDAGYHVIIASSRPASLQQETERWLNQWGVRYHECHVSDGSKAYNADNAPRPLVFVDDNAKVAKLASEDVTVFILKRPYTPDGTPNVVDSWQPILDAFGVTVDEVPQLNETVDAAKTATDDLVAAGICVIAANTGRMLMLQRRLKDDQKQAAGRWEFPGGRLDPGETAWQAAVREWQEETGNELPDGHTVSVYNSEDGTYRAFIYVIARESLINLNPDREAMQVRDPDHPRAKQTEVMAWWKVKDAKKSDHALRDEFEDFDWSLVKDAVKEYAHKMMSLDKSFGDPGNTQGRDDHGRFGPGSGSPNTAEAAAAALTVSGLKPLAEDTAALRAAWIAAHPDMTQVEAPTGLIALTPAGVAAVAHDGAYTRTEEAMQSATASAGMDDQNKLYAAERAASAEGLMSYEGHDFSEGTHITSDAAMSQYATDLANRYGAPGLKVDVLALAPTPGNAAETRNPTATGATIYVDPSYTTRDVIAHETAHAIAMANEQRAGAKEGYTGHGQNYREAYYRILDGENPKLAAYLRDHVPASAALTKASKPFFGMVYLNGKLIARCYDNDIAPQQNG